jgi:hypothetical protein
MSRSLVLLALLLAPAVASAQTFNCPEHAFDLTACTDPSDLDTCPLVCVDPADPTTCGMLPLPELATLDRTAPTQPILRRVDVAEGPFAGTSLTRVTLNSIDDAVFAGARGRLCTVPPATGDPSPTTPNQSPTLQTGPLWYGPNPGINGPNPGIWIRR